MNAGDRVRTKHRAGAILGTGIILRKPKGWNAQGDWLVKWPKASQAFICWEDNLELARNGDEPELEGDKEMDDAEKVLLEQALEEAKTATPRPLEEIRAGIIRKWGEAKGNQAGADEMGEQG